MLKRFFPTIKKALYSPAFYKEQLDQPLGPGFGYYFLFILLLSLIQVAFSLPAFFNAQADIKHTVSQFVSNYPKDLDVTIKNGTVSTTAPEPYVIPLPPSDTSAKQPKNALVLDTQTPYSSKQFMAYDTLSWVTKDTVYYEDGQSQIKSADLHQISNLHVNRPIVLSVWNKALPYTVWLAPVFAGVVFIGLFLGGIWRLVYLLFLSLLALGLGKMWGKQLRFKQVYGILLYAVTLPLFIITALSVFSALTFMHAIPFVFTVLTLLAVIANLFVPFKSGKKGN